MKKLLGFLLLLLVLVLGWSYFLLPSSVTVESIMYVHAPAPRMYYFLSRQKEWSKWWPVQTTNQADSFFYNGNKYRVAGESLNIVETATQLDGATLDGGIVVAPKTNDSTLLEWSIQLPSGSNPFRRIRHYFTADNIKRDMTGILSGLKKFAEKQENIYGMNIERAMVTDTVLVSTRASYAHYPSTQEVYELISKLKKYIQSGNATETNAPMLNIQPAGSNQYNMMVAIPTNKLLKGKGDIELKRMVPGKIIWSEVKGGRFTVEAAIEQLENYKLDNRLTSPAIPFASLVTDRMKEPDTTKWITRVYYPVF